MGDSAYPCLQQLMTPYRDNGHLSAKQKNFNYKLSSSRIQIEHSFGILKQRFRQLYGCKLRSPKIVSHFIRACFVLHNICDTEDMDHLSDEPLDDDSTETRTPDLVDEVIRGTKEGQVFRDRVCRQIWSARRSIDN